MKNFLDDHPQDWVNNPEYEELQQLLVFVADDSGHMKFLERLANESGISSGRFPELDNLDATCHALIVEMGLQGKLRKLVEVAKSKEELRSEYRQKLDEMLTLPARPAPDAAEVDQAQQPPGPPDEQGFDLVLTLKSRWPWIAIGLALVLIVVFALVRPLFVAPTPPSEPTETAAVVEIVTTEPGPSPTDTYTPTATPTGTPTSTPSPTHTPTPSPTPAQEVPEPYGPIWERLDEVDRGLLGKAGEPVSDRYYADQEFEGGYMFWRDNGGTTENWIYVMQRKLAEDGTPPKWWRFPDAWAEGDQEYACDAARPPHGPRRGFGLVWCKREEVQRALAAPTDREYGRSGGGWLDFDHGVMLLDKEHDRVFVLFEQGSTWKEYSLP